MKTPPLPSLLANYFRRGRGLFCVSALLIALGCVSALAQVPAITSLSPESEKTGGYVTITGTNFGANPQSAVVSFGAVRTAPIDGSSSSLFVAVPKGATYSPITVKFASGKTAQSSRPFTPTFMPVGRITSYSFAQNPTTFPASGWPPLVNLTGNGVSGPTQGTLITDFDGDGKPDLAVADWNSNNVVIFQNRHVSGRLMGSLFNALPPMAVGSGPIDAIAGDLNGDGLPDLVVANSNSSTLSIFQNTSTVTRISFSNAFTIQTPYPAAGARGVKVADFDGDGYLDIIVSSEGLGIFRNKGLGGTLGAGSFQTMTALMVSGGAASGLAVGDIDGDQKPDLLVTGYPNKVSVLRNNSMPGSIGFAPPLQLTTSVSPNCVALGDLDGDGKAELIVGTPSSTVSIFRNISYAGYLGLHSFDPRVDLQISPSSQFALSLSIADLNGDGKPEIIVANRYDSVFIAVNGGVSGIAASFTSFQALNISAGDAANGSYGRVAIGDLNADNRPDLVVDGELSRLQVSENFVQPVTVTSFAISPSSGSVTIPWYRTRNLIATQGFSDGSSADVSAGATWSSSSPEIATVNANGQAVGKSVGQTVVTAVYQGSQAQTNLTVDPVVFGTNAGNPDGRFLPVIANGNEFGAVKAFAVQSDGKVIVGGQFSSINGTARQNIARLNEDGSVDLTFDPGSSVNGYIEDLELDAFGRVIIAGRFTEVAGMARNYIARLMSNGAADGDFNANLITSSSMRTNAVQIQRDGLIFVGGTGLRVNGDTTTTYLLRLDAVGAKDPNFSAGVISYGELNAMALQPGGKIVIGGSFGLRRLESDGAFDSGFSIGITSGSVNDIALQPDQKMVVVGDFSSVFGNTVRFITRLSEDGTLDGTFNAPTTSSWGIVSAVAIQKNGKIIVSKSLETVRLTTSGSIDTSYNTTVHPDWAVSRIFVTPDEKIWISGGITSVNGSPTMGIARLHGDVTTFRGWQTKYFSTEQLKETGLTGPNGDAVGDGVKNLLKYASGSDPRLPAPGAVPVQSLVTNDGDTYLQFTYRRLRAATDLRYEIGMSYDMQNWNFSGAFLEQAGDPVISNDGLTEAICLRLANPLQNAPKTFLKLRVSQIP